MLSGSFMKFFWKLMGQFITQLADEDIKRQFAYSSYFLEKLSVVVMSFYIKDEEIIEQFSLCDH